MSTTKKFVLLIATFAVLIAAVSAVDCYICFYDAVVPELLPTGANKACASMPFDAENVKTESGFNKCYKAIVEKNGVIVSAHRGGGVAAISNFASIVTRDEDSYEIDYCTSNLCNGAPSYAASMGLLTSVLTLMYSFKFM